MPDAELEAMGLTPEQGKLFAEKMAQVQVQVTGSVMRLFTQQMPNYVQGLLQRRQVADDSDRQFWSDNPHLAKAEHEQLAIEVGQIYRQHNPKASPQEFNKFVGDYVGMRLGRVRPVPGAPRAPQAPWYHVASLPPVQTPGRFVRPNSHIPYSPAGSNNAPPGSLPQPQDTPWGQMMETIRAFDDGRYDR